MAALLRRELALSLRSGGSTGIAVGFFVLTVVLAPLGIGREPELLARIAGGIVWIAALLATLLSLDRIFQADHEDGSLDQLILCPLALEQIVAVKILAHWLATGLPMTLAAPLLGIMLQLPIEASGMLAVSALLGTPALSAIGAVGAAITLGVRRGGLLLSILVLPLYIPSLVFAGRTVSNAALGLDPWPTLGITAALSLFAAAVAPFAASMAIRISLR
ncbi:MAG: heme exporter protein CcmB [Pseudomonadota bacterium]